MVSLFASIFTETVHMLVLAAPLLLLGLAMAGIMHVALPSTVIERWLGRPGWGGIVRAASIGVPLPICSCGVVPIAVELKRKKASDPASMSFLITTPESGADSVLLTWAMMGPVMAIARPLAAIGSALLGGALALKLLPQPDSEAPTRHTDQQPCSSHEVHPQADDSHADGHSSHACGCDHHHDAPVLRTDGQTTGTHPPSDWRSKASRASHYAFKHLFDELAAWLVIGALIAGVLSAVLPDDLARYGLGAGPLGLIVMLLAAIPIYVCASASTPIAAALTAKGLSPGAALVFLLAGPATNAASLVLLARTFGRRFVQVYLAGVVIGALAAGAMLDLALLTLGMRLHSPLMTSHHHQVGILEGAAFAVLVGLLVASARRGALTPRWRRRLEPAHSPTKP